MTEDFKNKIIKSVEENRNKIIKNSYLKDEYFKLFKKMDSPDKGHLDFEKIPKDIFKNFNYDLFFEDYSDDVNIDINKYLPDNVNKNNVNIIVLLNGYLSNKYTNIISKDIVAKSLDKKVKEEYLDIEKYFLLDAEQYENPLTVLNVFLAIDGLYIYIPKNVAIKEPIYIFSIITDNDKDYLFNQRILCLLDENSEATIIEHKISLSNNKSVFIQVNEINLLNNSKLNYYNLSDTIISKQKQNEKKFVTLSSYEHNIGKNAICNVSSIDTNPNFSRKRANFRLGENSELNINSFSFVTDDNVVNYRTLVEHQADNSKCNQMVKAVTDAQSKFIFTGKIKIESDVKKINAHQNSRIITLSDNADIVCDPQLEIYSDDVICTHGAAIGNPNEDIIFYLQSRGINSNLAKKILLEAFANEIYDTIKEDNLRESLKKSSFLDVLL